MKITKNSFLIPVIIFSVLIVIVAFSLKNIITLNNNSNWVIHSYKVKLALANNISLLKDIETGERGFVLTGNKDFKEFSDLAIPEIQKNILHLQYLITDKNQLLNLDSLKLLIKKKIAISNEIINIREQHGLNAAVEKVGSLKGKLIMDDIRDFSKNMEVLAEELLTDRIEDSYGSFLFAKIFVLVGGILAILIAIFLMIINNKSLKLKTRLLKSEAKFKQVLESAPDGIVVIGNNRKIQMVNAQTENLFGYTKDEMIGKKVQMLMPDRFREGHPAHERKFITDQKPRAMGVGKELFGKRKDGSEFAIEISLVPLQLGDEKEGGMVLATIRDITEQKKTERKIITSQAYTRSLIEASLDPLVTISAEGKITDVNEALAKVTGETRDKLIGTDFSDYFTEPEKAREGYKQVFEKGFVSDYPLTIHHTTGKLTDVLYNASVYKDDKGNVLGVFAAARDVTEQKSVEEKIRQSEEMFKSIFDNSLASVLVADDQGNYLSANKAAGELLGYSVNELLQMNVSDLKITTQPGAAKRFEEYMKKGEETGDFDFIRKNGARKFAQYQASRIKPDFNLSILMDITEQKQASQYARSLIEASLDPLVTISAEGKITDVNEALAKVTGETRDKLIGTDFSDYFTEPEKAREGYKQVFDKGFVSDYPLTIHHTTGKLIEVLYNASVYKDDKGNVLGVFAAARDVTNKKAEELIIANKELAFQNEEKEKRSDELMIANKELVFQNEEKEKRADELIIANKELAFQNEEKEKRANELIIANKELAFQNEEKEKRAAELIIADLEIIVQNKEKEKREIAANELKAFNLSIQRASLYARSLIEAATDPLVTISPEGKITDVNEASVKVTGVSRDKLIGTDFSDYFTEPEKAREGYKQVFDKGFVSDYPLTIHHATGKLTDVLYNASVYKDDKGSVLGVFAAARDVTAQKKLERDVADREKELGRLIELERFRKLTVGRELKMIELKKENEELRGKLGIAKDENS